MMQVPVKELDKMTRTFEPVRLNTLKCFNWSLQIDEVENGDVRATPEICVLSLITAKSSPGYLEVKFRLWLHEPSAAYEFQRALGNQRFIFVTQFSSWVPAEHEGIDYDACILRKIRVDFDRLEVAPIDLDMGSSGQATESIFFISPSYKTVEVSPHPKALLQMDAFCSGCGRIDREADFTHHPGCRDGKVWVGKPGFDHDSG